MSLRLPDIIPLSDLEQDAGGVLRRVRESQTPAVITRRGRAQAVLISIESFRQAEAERELLARLARGEQEIAEGRGYDLDSVFAEADDLLKPRES
jgi:prevent-host-death family protein